MSRTLHFQRGPAVLMQDDQIGDALNIIRIVLQNHSVRKALPDFLDQPVLIFGFPHAALLLPQK